jgi:hypothetical protein
MKPERLPYRGTHLSTEQTQAQIRKLLYKSGAKGVQWTTIGERVRLAFVLEEDGNTFTIRVDPPLLVDPRKNATNAAASMRLLLWWLKSQLEAIRYGLFTAKEAFLAQIAGRLPSGSEVTVGEIIIPKLTGFDATELAKALPSKGGHP